MIGLTRHDRSSRHAVRRDTPAEYGYKFHAFVGRFVWGERGECWAKIIWTDERLTNVTYDVRRCRSNCGARRLSRKNRRHFREKFGDEIPRLLFDPWLDGFQQRGDEID